MWGLGQQITISPFFKSELKLSSDACVWCQIKASINTSFNAPSGARALRRCCSEDVAFSGQLHISTVAVFFNYDDSLVLEGA